MKGKMGLQPKAMCEVTVRVLLLCIAAVMDKATPFERHLEPEELWLYKNPRTASYVTATELSLLVFVVIPCCLAIYHLLTGERRDARQCFWSYSLACSLCGAITNVAKVLVGRPRPDFFYRCFPDGHITADMKCTGELDDIVEGRKSFPSGHSSWSFMGLGFASWYMSGKLHTFGTHGAGEGWRLVLSIAPLLCAATIALSRTCDYHHHWQDVAAGSALGLIVSYVCYRQYYPSLEHHHSDRPLTPASQRLSDSTKFKGVDFVNIV